MRVQRAVRGSRVAMMTFDELCGSALGAADYTAISEAFHTLFVHGVPMMNLVHVNQAREGGRANGSIFLSSSPCISTGPRDLLLLCAPNQLVQASSLAQNPG